MTLRLEPWGRIEGVVDARCGLRVGETIHLADPCALNYSGRLILSHTADTGFPDAQGRFVIDLVPPGEWALSINQGVGRQIDVLNDRAQPGRLIERELLKQVKLLQQFDALKAAEAGHLEHGALLRAHPAANAAKPGRRDQYWPAGSTTGSAKSRQGR